MENNNLSLLCDEEPFFTPTASPKPASPRLQVPPAASSSSSSSCPSFSCAGLPIVSSEERESFLADLLQREHSYAPCSGYCDQLQEQSPYLPAARTRSIRYVILVCTRLNLSIGTAFRAVNFLDRFISMNCIVKWEDWMMELLSVACLSIASKMDEVSIPSLQDLQTEDLERSFKAGTILQMELTVLKTLDWLLACVTPFSYVEAFTSGLDVHVATPFITRMIELLLFASMDCRFLRFSPSNLAAAALKIVVPAIGAAAAAFPVLPLPNIPAINLMMSEVNECEKMMRDVFRSRMQFGGAATNGNDGVLPDAAEFSSKRRCLSDVSAAAPSRKKRKTEDGEIALAHAKS